MPRTQWLMPGWPYQGLFALVPHSELVHRVARRIPTNELGLDAGSGIGMLSAFAGAGRRIVSVDVSPSMLARARRHCPRVLRADVSALPFASGSFRWVASVLVLYAVPNKALAIQEMARVLAPGGRLLLATPVTAELTPLIVAHWRTAGLRDHLRFVANLPRLLAWTWGLVRSRPGFVFSSEEETRRLIENAGLDVSAVEPCYADLGRLFTASKRVEA